MRVLINASVYTGSRNGLGIYAKEVVNAINSLNINDLEFKVFSFNEVWQKGIEHREISYDWLQKLVSFGSISIYRIIWNLFVLPFLSREFDLVYSLSPHGSVFIKNKQIITVHDLIGLDKKISLSQSIYYRTIFPAILKQSKRIISISNATKEDLKGHVDGVENRVQIIYNGADHLKPLPYSSMTSPKIDLEMGKYFILVGASFSHKNVETVISVFNSLKEYKLIIVHGKNKYSKGLQNKYSEMKNVSFVSELSNEDLVSLYRNALGNIYVSLKEGFGFPPFEAALNDTVSIVSEIDCLKEIYADGSVIYVDPYSIDDIKEKVLNLAEGQYDNDLLLQVAKKRLSEFTWHRTANSLVKLFNEIKRS